MLITPEISKKLLELKDDCGMTFKQIGDEVGSSEANVRRYIMGETKVPDKQLLYSIILTIGGDPEKILGKTKPELQAVESPAKAQPGIDYVMYEKLEDRRREEIANLKAAYDSTIQSKDNWIDRITKERDEAEEEIEKLENDLLEAKKERRNLQITIGILAALVLLFILIYFIPDIANGNWGHITYAASSGLN